MRRGRAASAARGCQLATGCLSTKRGLSTAAEVYALCRRRRYAIFGIFCIVFNLFCGTSLAQPGALSEDVADRVARTSLIAPLFRAMDDSGNTQTVPFLLEALAQEEAENALRKEDKYILYDGSKSSTHAGGTHSNIHKFFDDPFCDILIFPQGLFVCGDLRVRNSVTVVTGMNLTLLLSPPRPAIRSRCTYNPPSVAPDGTWCLMSATVRAANLYVSNILEVGGSLFARRLRVDAAASVFVGLRGIPYVLLSLRDLSEFVEEYARSNSELSHRRATAVDQVRGMQERRHFEAVSIFKVSDHQSRYKNKPPKSRESLSLHEYRRLLETRQKPLDDDPAFTYDAVPGPEEFENDTETDFVHELNSTARRRLGPRGAGSYVLEKSAMLHFRCPVISPAGFPLFLSKEKNGTISVQLDFTEPQPNSPEALYYMNSTKSEKSPALAKFQAASALSRTASAAGAAAVGRLFSASQNWAPAYHSGRSSSKNGETYRPYGPYLPNLSGTATLGDLVTLLPSVLGNAASVYVFGNFVGHSVTVDAASILTTHCGQLYLNASDNAGLVAVRGSQVSLGGLLESVTSRVIAQYAASIEFSGSLIATRFLQARRASRIAVGGDLLAAIVTAADGSIITFAGESEVEFAVDIASGSSALFGSENDLTLVQVQEGSSLIIQNMGNSSLSSGQLTIFRDGVVINEGSKMFVSNASVLIEGGLHIANKSSLNVPRGDIFIGDTTSTKVVGSSLAVNGSFVSLDAPLLAGRGSDVEIGGSILLGGLTPDDVEETEDLLPKATHLLGRKGWNMAESAQAVAIEDAGSSPNPNSSDDELLRNETNAELNKKKIPVAALHVESSTFFVAELFEVRRSWVAFSKGSAASFGNGLWAHDPNAVAVHISGRSSVTVPEGDVHVGLGLEIGEGSLLEVGAGGIISEGTISLSDGASVQAAELTAAAELRLENNCNAVISGPVLVSGKATAVSGGSFLRCSEFRQRTGDLFVEDGSSLIATSGSVLVAGNAVVQDRGLLLTSRGSVVSMNGDIVCENMSGVSAGHAILLYSEFKRRSAGVLGTGERNNSESFSLDLDVTGISGPKFWGSGQSVAGTTRKTTRRQETYLPKGELRRSIESVFAAAQIIPADLNIKLFVQEVPEVLLPRENDSESAQDHANEAASIAIADRLFETNEKHSSSLSVDSSVEFKADLVSTLLKT